MKYRDLRDFVAQLEAVGELKRLAGPVSARFEMTIAMVASSAPLAIASIMDWRFEPRPEIRTPSRRFTPDTRIAPFDRRR